MTLAQYLRAPVPFGMDCARWTLRWLKLCGKSDVIDRLDRAAVARAYATGEVLAYASHIAAIEGFRISTDPAAGDPCCALAPMQDGTLAETLGLCVGEFFAAPSGQPHGRVMLTRRDIIRAWRIE